MLSTALAILVLVMMPAAVGSIVVPDGPVFPEVDVVGVVFVDVVGVVFASAVEVAFAEVITALLPCFIPW